VTAAYVTGTGLWAPGFRDAAAWLARAPDPAATSAPAELLPAALRRRASVLSRMVAEAAAAAAARSGADLAEVAMVLGSAYGEIASAAEMIRSFREEGEGLPSPTRFHNSVHNTPVAYLSMAAVNRGLATAVAAGEDTAAMALLEALGVLEERGGEVLLVLADEAVPPPLVARRAYAAGAVALVLSASAASGAARLGAPRRGAAPAPGLPPGFAEHPCAGGFALLSAAASRRAGPVPLGPAGAGADGWVVDLEPAGAA
jgi:hypothetical protein